MKFLLFYLLCIGPIFVESSLFCPYTKYSAPDSDFLMMRVQVKERPEQELMYRISDENNPGFEAKSTPFRLMETEDNNECPGRVCLTELSAAEPKHRGSILYHTSILGKMIPPGFQTVETSRRLYCVIFEGDCGASIPIHRHYRFTSQGIYHAYTIGENKTISNYTRETTPVCYVWPVEPPKEKPTTNAITVTTTMTTVMSTSTKRSIENAVETSETCQKIKRPPGKMMRTFRVYDNKRSGPMRDHYYTTRKIDAEQAKNTHSIYYNYTLQKDLGAVLTEPSACKCVIKLNQVRDYQEGIIRILDHKLVKEGETSIPTLGLINQTSTGEEIYCAMHEGACGATLPLRKFYHLADLDTIYTVNSTDVPLFTVPTPGVLCYIWDMDEFEMDSEEEQTVENGIDDKINNSLRYRKYTTFQ